MTTEAEAYTEGWKACMRGEDGRFTNPYPLAIDTEYQHIAWCHGFLDAMEAEDDDEPEPGCAGYY